MREALRSGDIDCRVGARVPLELARALAAPDLQATVTDLEFAHTVLVLGCEPLDEAPILDLRIRKGVRRRGVQLAVATARPSALDTNARLVVRYPPGEEAAFLASLAAGGEDHADLSALLRDGGEDVVIVWGERRLGPDALRALLRIAGSLGLAGRDGAGLLEIPAGANGRGLREAGALPGVGPGYVALDGGRGAAEIAAAAAEGQISALYLFQSDPVRDYGDRTMWERALRRAGLVVAHASMLTDGIREHADVVFPAESHAEKEGTVVHPDGRLQRLRIAIAHPGQVRAGWSVLTELGRRLGRDMRVGTAPMAWNELAAAVPFYGGLTLEEIGGRGVRWPVREEAAAMPRGEVGEEQRPGEAAPTDDVRQPAGEATDAPPDQSEPATASGAQPDPAALRLRLGRYRPIWAAPEVEISPALHFTIAEQRIELSPADAGRAGIADGDIVEVFGRNGDPDAPARVRARAVIRTGVADGVAFLADGLRDESANVFTGDWVTVGRP